MSKAAQPPQPPRLDFTGSDDLSRMRLRLWQITMTAMTILISGWFCMMGPIHAIITLFITKHVLVAIVVVGAERDRLDEKPNPASGPAADTCARPAEAELNKS